MKITHKKDKEKISIKIDGDFNIYQVHTLKDEFTKFLKDKKNMELDLSDVQKIDTAGFQLITAVKREMKNQNKTFKIINPSIQTISLFSLYGENI